MAELDRRTGHAPTLVFFAEFWLRNLSSLPLVYGTCFAPPTAGSVAAIAGVNSSSSSGSIGGGGASSGRAAPLATSAASPSAAAGSNAGSEAAAAAWRREVGGLAGALRVAGGGEAVCCAAAWQDPGTPVVDELFEVAVREASSAAFSDTLARKKRVRTRLLMHGGDLLTSAAVASAAALRGSGGKAEASDDSLPGPGFRFLHWCGLQLLLCPSNPCVDRMLRCL
jgi:hypothetical protein